MEQNSIFAPIFGDTWQALPKVMKKHYANRAFSNDEVVVEGAMDIEIAPFMKLFSPLIKLMGALIPYAGKNLKTIVRYKSNPNNNHYELDREIQFPGRDTYKFRSHIVPLGNSQVMELMKSGMAWHAYYEYSDNKVHIKHISYKLKLFNTLITLPLTYIIGRGNAWEEVIDDNTFRLYIEILHPLFGKIYSYHGVFRIKEVNIA